MSYSAEINRANPACFLFLIDQSGSMSDPWGGSDDGISKAVKLSDAMNRLLSNLVIKCSRGDQIRQYFHVGVLGYGVAIRSALGGALAGREIVGIDEIGMNTLRVEERTRKVPDGAGGLVETTAKFPVWFDSVADGGTPMRQALEVAHGLVADWTAQHRSSYPPVIINITDGEATDAKTPFELTEIANGIKSLATDDGNILLLSLHLSSKRNSPVIFPNNETMLADDFARLLFQMSSPLPIIMQNTAKDMGYTCESNAKGFVFNAQLEQVIEFLEIGTKVNNLR